MRERAPVRHSALPYGTKDICANIFSEMMDSGVLKKGNPDMLAFAYTAPITLLVHYHDREPEKEPEILREIEAFVKHFINTYGIK